MDGREQIIKKLQIFFKNHVSLNNESDIVYLMAETRKLLELDNIKNNYDPIRFYCNLMLHAGLDNPRTTRFISDKFDKFVDPDKSNKEIAQNMIKNEVDFFKLKDFKDKLEKFLENHSLPTNFIKSNTAWITFVNLFFCVAEECPVVCIKSSKKIVSLELTKNKDEHYCYKFHFSHGGRAPVIKLKYN